MDISHYRTINDVLKSTTDIQWTRIKKEFKRIKQSNMMFTQTDEDKRHDDNEINKLIDRIIMEVHTTTNNNQAHEKQLIVQITSERKENEQLLAQLKEKAESDPDTADIETMLDIISETGTPGQLFVPSIHQQIESISESLGSTDTRLYPKFTILDDQNFNMPDVLTFKSLSDVLFCPIVINLADSKLITKTRFIANFLVELYELSYYDDEKAAIYNEMIETANIFQNGHTPNKSNDSFHEKLDQFLTNLPVVDDGIDH